MPTYGYKCQSCGNEFETVQKISDPALTTCELCGGTLKKRLYPVGISFKGSGFYVNDYSKSGGKSSDSGESGSGKTETPSETKSETKSDSSPAAPATGGDAKPASPASDSSTPSS